MPKFLLGVHRLGVIPGPARKEVGLQGRSLERFHILQPGNRQPADFAKLLHEPHVGIHPLPRHPLQGDKIAGGKATPISGEQHVILPASRLHKTPS